jgi:iron complex outermembrane recepter protein
MSRYFLLVFIVCAGIGAVAQMPADSTRLLDSVTVKVYEIAKVAPLSYSSITAPAYADFSSKTSLVNGLNSISGVRMEERSPGSYRINIRGSSLRSPFGVRNLKVYWNNIPLTDPGGNTYFNQLAWNNFNDITIVKGPASSMYGAGTGGLIMLNSLEGVWQRGITAEYNTGSYQLHNLFITARFGNRENKNVISYARNETAGYRAQSGMHRDNFSWVTRFKKDRLELSTVFLYTDLFYQTPGALTAAEFNTNPAAARPPAGGFPSAINAKAAIEQKNLLTGITGIYALAPGLKNTSSLYGAYAQVNNPAIRNYERRNEPSFGGRTVFTYEKRWTDFKLDLATGAEWQQGYFNTVVSKNRNGLPDTLQTNDDINNSNHTVFFHALGTIKFKWYLAAGAGINSNRLVISRLNNYPVVDQKRTYRNELAPQFSVSRDFGFSSTRLFVQILASKGFSPPTIAEILPSTGVINTTLEAEQGWNLESSLSYYLLGNKLKIKGTVFDFRLRDALVQRRDSSGADFFVNAGDTKQRGLELQFDYKHPFLTAFLRYAGLRTDITLNRFRYGSFIKGTDDFSGNTLPSVPSTMLNVLADIEFINGIYLNTAYYTASSIWLNDANTARDNAYHLLGMQAGYKKAVAKKRVQLQFFAGADNLLNETYSLGNDINAAAGRYFNAAPKRNYYAGLKVQWIKWPTK